MDGQIPSALFVDVPINTIHTYEWIQDSESKELVKPLKESTRTLKGFGTEEPSEAGYYLVDDTDAVLVTLLLTATQSINLALVSVNANIQYMSEK